MLHVCLSTAFVFVKVIKNQQEENEGQLKVLRTGHGSQPMRRTYKQINEQLEKLKSDLENEELGLEQYLDNCGYVLHLSK